MWSADTEGPFYPEKDQEDKDNDLTRVRGRNKSAKGEVFIIQGKVTDSDCRPVEGALVEIWQACATGRYNHSADPNTDAQLDEDFQYWGRDTTDKEGKFWFRTIKPGAYPAIPGVWDRPPHVHFKVQKRGYRELTSQMYFAGESLNEKDRILNDLTEAEKRNVIVDFTPLEDQPDIAEGRFNVIIKKI